MTVPRRVTPPSSRTSTQPPARPASPSSPWDLAELQAPATPSTPFALPRAGGAYREADVAHLRDQLQEQNARGAADARRAGYEEGRAAGRAEAQQAADQRVADAVHALRTAIASVQQHEETWVGALEENLTALACAVARQVIQREVQMEPSAIRELVHGAVTEFPQETSLRVRLHPQDHALLSSDASYRDVLWVADARVVRGGCVVEGRERILDGRVDLALEQLYRVLTGLDA